MDIITNELKRMLSDLGVLGWSVIVCYIGILGISLIRRIIAKEQRKQIMAERQKIRMERHRAFMENHRMRKLEHQERMKNIQLRNAYYDSRRRINRINYNNLRTQAGKVYGKWK